MTLIVSMASAFDVNKIIVLNHDAVVDVGDGDFRHWWRLFYGDDNDINNDDVTLTTLIVIVITMGRYCIRDYRLKLKIQTWYPGPRGFLSPWRDEKRERKKRREKTSVCGRCEWSRESINKQPMTTHLSVNTSQSKYVITFFQSGGRIRSWP